MQVMKILLKTIQRVKMISMVMGRTNGNLKKRMRLLLLSHQLSHLLS